MRVLFYLGTAEWSATARAVLAVARGLSPRGHVVAIACCHGSRLQAAAQAAGIDTVVIHGSWFGPGGAWDLRNVLKSRFIEVAVVTSDTDHRIVASAMRFAERGGVLRRLQPFEEFDAGRASKLSLKMAPSGLVVSSPREATNPRPPGWAIPTAVAPLGVDLDAYDAIDPASRAEIGAPPEGLLLVCDYDRSGRNRAATAIRAVALLALRHPHLHAVLVGPGSDDDDLLMHASALGVGGIISFLGERDDALAVMRAADAGWVVSGGDAGAFAFLDFMALSIPVIADRWPLAGCFVADGTTGVLLASDDPARTASTVAASLTNPERRAAMGNAARAKVQREFSEAAMIDGFDRAVNMAGDRTTWPPT